MAVGWAAEDWSSFRVSPLEQHVAWPRQDETGEQTSGPLSGGTHRLNMVLQAGWEGEEKDGRWWRSWCHIEVCA